MGRAACETPAVRNGVIQEGLVDMVVVKSGRIIGLFGDFVACCLSLVLSLLYMSLSPWPPKVSFTVTHVTDTSRILPPISLNVPVNVIYLLDTSHNEFEYASHKATLGHEFSSTFCPLYIPLEARGSEYRLAILPVNSTGMSILGSHWFRWVLVVRDKLVMQDW